MVRVALVASLLGVAEGGFRMTGYRSLGCLSTSMGWGDSEIRCALARRARAAQSPPRARPRSGLPNPYEAADDACAPFSREGFDGWLRGTCDPATGVVNLSAFADESCSAAVDVLTFGDDECLEVQGGWFLVYYEWSMKLECLADCDADVSYCAYPTIAPTTTPSRRPTAGPRAARATRAPSLGGDDDDDDGDLSRAAAAVIAGAARGPRPGEGGGGARATSFLAQVALFIVGCAAIASVYARRALPHDDATFDTLPTGGAPAPPPVPVAVPAPRRAELESSTRLQCANVLTRALRPCVENSPRAIQKISRIYLDLTENSRISKFGPDVTGRFPRRCRGPRRPRRRGARATTAGRRRRTRAGGPGGPSPSGSASSPPAAATTTRPRKRPRSSTSSSRPTSSS